MIMNNGDCTRRSEQGERRRDRPRLSTRVCARCRHRLPVEQFSQGWHTVILARPVCDGCAAVPVHYDPVRRTETPIQEEPPNAHTR